MARLDRVTTLVCQQVPVSLDVINLQTACILALESLRVTYDTCTNIVGSAPGSPWRWPIYVPDLFVLRLKTVQPI